MSWWSKLFSRKASEPSEPPEPPGRREEPRAKWLPADQNRFGVPVLDLIAVTGKLISTSTDPQRAAMAVSWTSKFVADLAPEFASAESLACELRYPAERDLPDGWLFAPSQMEQKWAIAYRDEAIYLMRSWTGVVSAVGRARRDGDEIVVERVERVDDTLSMLGDSIEIFDWILRAHALGQQVPLPIAGDAVPMLEAEPLRAFSLFGHIATCAATSWSPPPPPRALRSTSDVVTAVRNEDEARVRALVAGGASLDARSAVAGYTALHVAAIRGSVAMTQLLLELGANPNVLADRGMCVLITAVAHRAPMEMLELLAKRSAVATPNAEGFGLLHAIAETDHAEYLAWGLARGLDLEGRTRHGHTPLHVAAALGHVAALRALLAAGADREAKDPHGRTARDIAIAENKPASVSELDSG
ncbi:MAG TPA: ankyrin repeat domain-containing protein [Kofleriaceae bacterium]